MDGAICIPLDAARLTPISATLLARFVAWRPDWLKHCQMDDAGDLCDLRIQIPSPTGNPKMEIQLWFSRDSTDISLSGWETVGTSTGSSPWSQRRAGSKRSQSLRV